MSRTMQRARRSARAVLHGPEILELLQEAKIRRLLVAAADFGCAASDCDQREVAGTCRAEGRKAHAGQAIHRLVRPSGP